MAKINAGVVLVTKFVSADSDTFSGYIDYMNRSNAVRNDYIEKYTIPSLDDEIKQYNNYMEYMADSRKTTELFTNNNDRLNVEEKEKLKEIFETAQNNNSLMWQTVISFDNKWLAQNGILDLDTGILDEVKIKEYTRVTMNTLLEKEQMDHNSIWSASIHYNTDNIHIHIATVQPIPQRELKTIKTIRFNKEWIRNNVNPKLLLNLETEKKVKAHNKGAGGYLKLLNTINKQIVSELGVKCKLGDYIELNSDGTIDVSYFGDNKDIPYMARLQNEITTQKGIFKESSIESAKSRLVNKVLGNTLTNEKINQLMRNTIIKDFNYQELQESKNLKQLYFDLHQQLPKNKRLWQYNNNVITPVRQSIDKFVSLWIEEYHNNDWKYLNEYLNTQQEMYQIAYGGNCNDFSANKIKDLYSRLGNIVLKNLKELSDREYIDFEDIDFDNSPFITESTLSKNNDLESDLTNSFEILDDELENYLSIFSEQVFLKFSSKYKKAKLLLYGSTTVKQDQEAAFLLFQEEAKDGNIYALYDLANCFKKGLGCIANATVANALYRKALNGFQNELTKLEQQYNNSHNDKLKNNIDYLKYRIGKMFYYGQGTKTDRNKAFDYFSDSRNNIFSLFYIAKFYENGELGVVKKDVFKAFDSYSEVCTKGKNKMPYAYYKKAYMLENGIGTTVNEKEAQIFYKKALELFEESVKSQPDDFLEYRLGSMYLNGKGCKIDIERAIYYFEKSIDAGNDMAACSLSMLYIKNNRSPEEIKKAYQLLHNSADKNNNALAQFNLGKLYLEQNKIKDGIKYLTKSADQGNQFAQYKLGAYFMENKETLQQGLKYLTLSADQDNQFAQYKLGAYYLKNKSTISKGIDYLEQSAEQNNVYAILKLGTFYSKSDYYDFKKAESYLLRIVGNNFDLAEYNLGSLYVENKSNYPLLLKGIDYLKTAAEQGNQFAQYKLGKLFYYGNEFIQPNSKLADLYLNAAAKQGNEFAIKLLNRPLNNSKINLRRNNLPNELYQSFYNLVSEMSRDYRDIENIKNQIEYNKLQNKIEEEREQL